MSEAVTTWDFGCADCDFRFSAPILADDPTGEYALAVVMAHLIEAHPDDEEVPMIDPLRAPETDDEPWYRFEPDPPPDARAAGCALMIASALVVVVVAWRLLEAALDAIRRALR